MSATQSTSDGLVYSSKEELAKAEAGQAAVTAIKKQGYSGWRRNIDGHIVELVYLVTPEATTPDWVEKETHRQNIQALRQRNRNFHKSNPALLLKKIRDKRKGSDFFIRCY
jgi:hypothetical protein